MTPEELARQIAEAMKRDDTKATGELIHQLLWMVPLKEAVDLLMEYGEPTPTRH